MGSALTRGADAIAAAQVLRARKVIRNRRCLYPGKPPRLCSNPGF